MPTRRLHHALHLTTALSAAALLVMSLTVGFTYGGLNASINNTLGTAGSGTMLFKHTYNSNTCSSVPGDGQVASGGISNAIQTVPCAASILPATAASARSDVITNRGSLTAASVKEEVSTTSCAPLREDNAKSSTNLMLPRYGTTLSASGGPYAASGDVALDGANPGGYLSSVVQSAGEPNPALSLGSTFGLGIWFMTSSTSGGPLFGFGDSAVNTAGSNDRILYMNASGRIGFGYTTGNAAVAPPGSGTQFNDGAWHFAYVTLNTVTVILTAITTITIYVDGAQTGQFSNFLAGGLNSYAGYWHLGWSPLTGKSYGTGLSNYFAGSLSDFDVFDTSPAPAASNPASQAAIDTFASSATQYVRLNNAPTDVVAAATSLPSILTTSPCSYVDIAWDFTTPLSCATAPQSTTAACTTSSKLSTFANGAWQAVAPPAPGATTQTSTITLTHDATNTGTAATYLTGLIIYAPSSVRVYVGASFGATAWKTAFTWNNGATGASSASTFIL